MPAAVGPRERPKEGRTPTASLTSAHSHAVVAEATDNLGNTGNFGNTGTSSTVDFSCTTGRSCWWFGKGPRSPLPPSRVISRSGTLSSMVVVATKGHSSRAKSSQFHRFVTECCAPLQSPCRSHIYTIPID